MVALGAGESRVRFKPFGSKRGSGGSFILGLSAKRSQDRSRGPVPNSQVSCPMSILPRQFNGSRSENRQKSDLFWGKVQAVFIEIFRETVNNSDPNVNK